MEKTRPLTLREIDEVKAFAAEERKEIEIYRKYEKYYSYVFYVLHRGD